MPNLIKKSWTASTVCVITVAAKSSSSCAATDDDACAPRRRRPGGGISNALPKFIVVTVPTTVLYGKSMPEECNFAEKRIFEMSFSLRQCISSAVFQILYCCCWLAGCFSLKRRRRRQRRCGDLDPRSRPQRLLQKLRNNYENRGAGLTFKRT